ncbi:hypothetical protein K439DRAFT_1131286 [Ramaria rubella]|nr:hypothetical protein K439DRAFT_1131286 [Ramaria rubella]
MKNLINNPKSSSRRRRATSLSPLVTCARHPAAASVVHTASIDDTAYQRHCLSGHRSPHENQVRAYEKDWEDYTKGGYYPVHIVDAFFTGRYIIVRRLGWDHFSTVWLVRDTKLDSKSSSLHHATSRPPSTISC